MQVKTQLDELQNYLTDASNLKGGHAQKLFIPETAFITDLGMTGSYSGVIGMKKEDVITRFTSALGRRAEHSSGEVRICGAVIDIDETTGKARALVRINLPHEQ